MGTFLPNSIFRLQLGGISWYFNNSIWKRRIVRTNHETYFIHSPKPFSCASNYVLQVNEHMDELSTLSRRWRIRMGSALTTVVDTLRMSSLGTTLDILTRSLCTTNKVHALDSVSAFHFPFHNNNFIADIAKKAIPAVVFVEIKGEHHKSGKRVTLANGSGFIVTDDGLVLTNAHVVENKSRVTVKLSDGSTYDGLVSVVDPVSDLAIIKMKLDADHRQLPVIPLGKSSELRPGEFVAAMGSPLSLHKTITVGIVSSPLRDSNELGLQNKMDYIQTDAVIGLGNSGGPLVNMDGEAIGINTLKLTEGISFAIPSDYAFKIISKAQALVAKDKETDRPSYFPLGRESAKRRYMGITMLSLTPQIILELKDKQRDFPNISFGVYVHKVVVSSPAYIGGLHAGDVIVSINGVDMETSADVYSMVERSDELKVKVIRGRNYEQLTVETETI